MTTWTWRPTIKQREVFEEWKQFCFGYLVSCREGVNVHRFPDLLAEHVGERFPLREMGLGSGNQFLYQLEDYIDVRKVGDGSGRLFVFIKENRVPSELQHIRDLVLRQAKEKGCVAKRTGRVLRPRRHQTMHCNALELLNKFAPTRFGGPAATGSGSFSPEPSSNFQTRSGLFSSGSSSNISARSGSGFVPRKSGSAPSGFTARQHSSNQLVTSTRNNFSRPSNSTGFGTATNGPTPNNIIIKPIPLMESCFTRPTPASNRRLLNLDLDFDSSEDEYLNDFDFYSGSGTRDPAASAPTTIPKPEPVRKPKPAIPKPEPVLKPKPAIPKTEPVLKPKPAIPKTEPVLKPKPAIPKTEPVLKPKPAIPQPAPEPKPAKPEPVPELKSAIPEPKSVPKPEATISGPKPAPKSVPTISEQKTNSSASTGGNRKMTRLLPSNNAIDFPMPKYLLDGGPGEPILSLKYYFVQNGLCGFAESFSLLKLI